MRKKIELGAYVLLVIGTLGLLMNEFVFAWGRPGSLIFAAVNVVGLAALGIIYWRKSQEASHNPLSQSGED